MTLPQLIENYGYYAVFVGALLEGETVLVMAGFVAYRGYLELPWVMACAGVGGFLSDQLYFYLGRRHGGFIMRRLRAFEAQAARVNRLLVRYDILLIVLIRFMYGMRIAGPALIGMSAVAAWRFVLFNLMGAALWAALLTSIGFLFGRSLETVLADIHRYELLIVAAIAVAGGVFWIIMRRRRNGAG
ncbi:MAG: DedA family protein [Betaproteobacteria bacterium]|nr:DedA family protein [Betaproteobacteria bacterium]